MANSWCLLRTGGRCTLPLTQSLSTTGIQAWTPRMMTERSLLPRSTARREREVPIMPSYVFASVDRLDDLLMLEQRPGRHHSFSLFRHLGRIALFNDRDLEPLREAEIRAVPKRRRRPYRPGQMVRIPEGPFGGMSGIVEKGDGYSTLVCFGGRIRVRISNFLLRDYDEQRRAA